MIRSKLVGRVLLLLALTLVAADPADAGLFRRGRARHCRPAPAACRPRCGAPAAAVAYPAAGVAPTPQASAQAPAPAADGSPLAWLNAARQARGLRPLAWSASAAADAARNSAMGFGHFTRSYGRGQVVGVGPPAAVYSAWLASPSHYAILMDPAASSAGAAASGAVLTISTN